MYYFPQPPIFLPVIGLAIALIFGVTFQKQLEPITQQWRDNPKGENAYSIDNKILKFSYTGICLGVWLFLGGGFRVLGFGIIGAYGVALPITIGTGAFMWKQFGEMLMEIKENGSQSINLDDYID